MSFGFGLAVPRQVVAPAAAPAYTYATWNPDDKSNFITLSGGDLSAMKFGEQAHRGARATIGVTEGKWFYCSEITGSGGNVILGVALAGASMSSFIGADASGWGYYEANGNKVNSGSLSAYGSTYAQGATIGVGIDATARTMTGYILSGGAWVSQGVIDISNLVGALYPAVSLYQNVLSFPTLDGDAITTNFGASAFPAAVPSGYNAGVYTA